MLRVTLEAYTPERTLLGYLDIQNDGTGAPDIATYKLTRRDPQLEPLRSTTLANYPRQLGPWELVTQALLLLGEHPLWSGGALSERIWEPPEALVHPDGTPCACVPGTPGWGRRHSPSAETPPDPAGKPVGEEA